MRGALDRLPEDLGQLMRNVAVTIEHGPGPPGLPGFYQGIPLISRTSAAIIASACTVIVALLTLSAAELGSTKSLGPVLARHHGDQSETLHATPCNQPPPEQGAHSPI